MIRGIRWAVDEIGADIISLSLGLPAADPIPELEQACQYAVDRGTAVFAASGNDYGAVSQPAIYDCVFAVAAVDSALQSADFSNRGKAVDFACGGVSVFSTYLNNGYAKLSGTSMATPVCAAAAALILADVRQGSNPRKLSPAELNEKLRRICFDLGPGGWDEHTGFGIPLFTNYACEGEPVPEPAPKPAPRPRKLATAPSADCLYWQMLSKAMAEANLELDRTHDANAAVAAGLRSAGVDVARINRSLGLSAADA